MKGTIKLTITVHLRDQHCALGHNSSCHLLFWAKHERSQTDLKLGDLCFDIQFMYVSVLGMMSGVGGTSGVSVNFCLSGVFILGG